MNTIVIEFKVEGGYEIPRENAELFLKPFKTLASKTSLALLDGQGIATSTKIYIK